MPKLHELLAIEKNLKAKADATRGASDKHPAQVKTVVEDTPTGDIITLEWSGLITVATKGDMLNRVEMFARAVKQARARANEQTISTADQQKIGAKIINYIFGL